ncbi:MAG: hypothetical protein L6R42_006391 [Xanthoria sp. 1 TBL-2021]|nr:MAG: hypothetical protein L6R42_006391 [Xanthoria sp. 1 TBL-2021]
MAYNNNNINQASGAGVPAGGESMPPGATRDFQPMGTTHQAPSSQSYQPSGATAEDKVQQQGHMPGLAEVKKDNAKDIRPPGQEDAAGNKIHRKSFLKKMFHWEHNGMNAD